MGILRRIVDRLDPPGETRATDPSWTHLAALSGGGTPTISARAAENLATVMACVNAISGGMGSLPAYVYRLSERGRDVDLAHPVARLVRDGPNEHQSWSDFLEWLVASTLLKGNGLAEVVTDGRGEVVELRSVPWEWVNVTMLPTGRLAYDISEMTSIYGGTGQSRRLLQGDVLHIRDRSDDGILGRSRLSRAAAVVDQALQVQQFAGSMWQNQAAPSGAVEVDGQLGHDAYLALRRRFEEAFTGPTNARKALILDQGLKWKSIGVSAEDAELLASRRFTAEELARLYQVPPPLVGIWDHSSFTNSETAGRWFAQHTLGPWVRKVEQAFRRSVFSAADRATHELEIDLSGFLRADPAARWQAHEIALRNQVLTPDEVREVEGWNPRGEEAAPNVG